MGMLDAALAWAQRGFSVFPLRENSREPIYDGWPQMATRDEATIRKMWTDIVLGTEKDFNIGCLCTDMVVVDVDIKKGKDGYNQYMQLGGTWDTLVVQTTSGGWHLYFQGPDSSNAGIASGVDIRSHNGYVVAPGSIIDNSPYVVVNDRSMTWVPPTVEKLLSSPYQRSNTTMETFDTPAAIEAAIGYLQTTHVAVEGLRGDETTFITAARLVRELALSVPQAYQLMLEHWNPRCSPPWEPAELYAKVENAAAYGSAVQGVLSAENIFGGLVIAPPPSPLEQSGTDWGNAILPERIAPRPWLLDGMLMRGKASLILAAGSAGKSSVALALAAHLAVGLDFAGHKVKGPCKSIVYNGEDDIQEQSRRLIALCTSYNLDFAKVRPQVMLLSQREMRMDLVAKQFNQPMKNEVIIKTLVDKASAEDVGLLILDPLVKVHKCDENDSVQMDAVMETITDIAHDADIAVLVLHHVAKAQGRQEDRIGNPDIGRGATGIVNACRVAFTLMNASQQDAEDYGMQDAERNLWVRLDDAKMNLSLATNNATWFKREGVKILSNDIVGVLRHEKLSRDRQQIRMRIADILMDTMTANGQGSLTISQAVAVAKEQEPLWANKTDTELRKRLEGLFSVAVEVRGRSLKLRRDPEDKNDKPILVLL